MKPGTAKVLRLLRERGAHGLTSIEALNAGAGFRLGARIWELRHAGYPVSSQLVTTPEGQRIARYQLES